MITKDEAAELEKKLTESRPFGFFKQLDERKAGINCLLRMLYESDSELSAGEISTLMGVSSARVAVLLKKMCSKGLIERQSVPSDARKVVVKLTDFGRQQIEERRREMLAMFTAVTERLGREKVEQFIALSEEIKEAVEAEISIHPEYAPDFLKREKGGIK